MIGRHIDHYRITSLLGRGTTGSLYGGVDLETNQEVALKVLHPPLAQLPTIRTRLEHTIHCLTNEAHPGLIRPQAVLPFEHSLVVISEKVDGKSLEVLLHELNTGLEHSQALPLFVQVATVAHRVHQHGLICGNLRPANILICATAEGPRIRVTDIGLHPVDDDGRLANLDDETLLPYLIYAAPEIIKEKSRPTVRSDVFGLGTTLYQMVTGWPPRIAIDGARLKQSADQSLRPPRSLCTGLAKELELALLTATAVQPNVRYATVENFLKGLEKLDASVISALLACRRHGPIMGGASRAGEAGRAGEASRSADAGCLSGAHGGASAGADGAASVSIQGVATEKITGSEQISGRARTQQTAPEDKLSTIGVAGQHEVLPGKSGRSRAAAITPAKNLKNRALSKLANPNQRRSLQETPQVAAERISAGGHPAKGTNHNEPASSTGTAPPSEAFAAAFADAFAEAGQAPVPASGIDPAARAETQPTPTDDAQQHAPTDAPSTPPTKRAPAAPAALVRAAKPGWRWTHVLLGASLVAAGVVGALWFGGVFEESDTANDARFASGDATTTARQPPRIHPRTTASPRQRIDDGKRVTSPATRHDPHPPRFEPRASLDGGDGGPTQSPRGTPVQAHSRTARRPSRPQMRIRVRVARLKAPASARPSIRRAIRKRIGRIRGCYRRLLRKHPQSKGNISVGFIVTKSGRVTSPLLMHSDIAQGAMNRCAVGAVGSMKTGALPDVVDANVVFSLQKR